MKKHNKLPPYMAINRGIFDDITDDEKDLNPELIKTDFTIVNSIDFSNTDIVCALPVCSGLSNATTTQNQDTKEARNNNMKWVSRYVMETIKPKAYIFENAPALFRGAKGKPIRDFIEAEAMKTGYSVTYFKTDTYLHHNAQGRPRTFCVCWKWNGKDVQSPPIIGYENAQISVKDFLEKMPTYINSKETEMRYSEQFELYYLKKRFPENWREKIFDKTVFQFIVEENLIDDFISEVEAYDKFEFERYRSQLISQIKHAKEKYDVGSWIFDTTLKSVNPNRHIPAIMHKNNKCMLHPFKDRPFTTGELAYCMGLPTDWEMYGGDYEQYNEIGQNVPVKTAKFICSEVARIVNDWDNLRNETHGNNFFGDPDNVEYVDNIQQNYSPT